MSGRYDFAAVDAVLDRRLEPVTHPTSHGHHQIVDPSDERKAELLGVSRQTVRRWRRKGLSEWQADRCAVRLGTHPALIWGQDRWREEGLTVLDDLFVNHGGWRTAWLHEHGMSA